MKACSSCKLEKSPEDFTKDSSRADGRAYVCKECRTRQGKKYRDDNVEKEKLRGARYRGANPEKTKSRAARYRKNNSEKLAAWNKEWCARNPDKVKSYGVKYGETDSGRSKLRAKDRLRRSRIMGHSIKSEGPTWQIVGPRDSWRCHICKKLIPKKYREGAKHDRSDPKAPTVDHLIPLFEGGPDTFANVLLAHRGCNSSKGCKPESFQKILFPKC